MFIILIGSVNYTPLETQKHYITMLSVTNIFKFVKMQILNLNILI